MKPQGTLLLKRSEVARLLGIEDCMAAVEQAFKLYAEGKTTPPGILGIHARDGGFHIKAGLLKPCRLYLAAKVNANFPHNTKRFGLPLIQGVIVLSDGENGYPLALMDSMEITIIRTGAATGVAARHLARPDAKTVTICGCGNQGRISPVRARPSAPMLLTLMRAKRGDSPMSFQKSWGLKSKRSVIWPQPFERATFA